MKTSINPRLKINLLWLTILLLSGCGEASQRARYMKPRPECAPLVKEGRYLIKQRDGRYISATAQSEAQFIDQYIKNSGDEQIEMSEPVYNVVQFANASPLDIHGIQAALQTRSIYSAMNAYGAWEMNYTGRGVRVGLVDAGVDVKHPLIRRSIEVNEPELHGTPGFDDDHNGYVDDVYGWNFITNSPNMNDEVGHGTHIAGVITAKDSRQLVRGLAPEARLIAVDFISQNGGNSDDAIRAIEYAISRGARIINASWTTGNCSYILQEAFADWNRNLDILFVTAAGNSGHNLEDLPEYPAVFEGDNKINVGAATLDMQRASFSNYGAWVDIYAPGVMILSSVPRSVSHTGMAYFDGSSMAAGFVSGTAALMLHANPNLTAAQLAFLLKSTSWENNGSRFLNVGVAVEKALEIQ